MYHCFRYGFDRTYKNWTCHGEMYVPFRTKEDAGQSNFGDDLTGMLHDAMGNPQKDANTESDHQSDLNELNGADVETKKSLKLLQDAETEEHHEVPPPNVPKLKKETSERKQPLTPTNDVQVAPTPSVIMFAKRDTRSFSNNLANEQEMGTPDSVNGPSLQKTGFKKRKLTPWKENGKAKENA